MGVQRAKKAIHRKTEKQMLGKQMFAGPAETVGHRVSSFTPSPYSVQIISGDSSVPVIGPLSKFFRELAGGSKVFPESFRLLYSWK